MTGRINRRAFLLKGTAAGGGLLLGFWLAPSSGDWNRKIQGASLVGRSVAFAKTGFRPNAYLHIGTNGIVTVMVPKSEMGQGVLTALPAILAEELDVDWSQVVAKEAPAAKDYRWIYDNQFTGGSDAVSRGWDLLRKAGAEARALMIQAASQLWGVSAEQCQTESGTVYHEASGRRASYGELATRAAQLRPPHHVRFKDPATYKIVGKRLARIDSPDKVNGKAQFGIDIVLPRMWVACVLRCPTFHGKVASFDSKEAATIAGVRQVLALQAGVAVVAEGYFAARQGLEKLKVLWNEGAHAELSTEVVLSGLKLAAERPEKTLVEAGNVGAPVPLKGRSLEAEFMTPFLAHATMEPLNCTADVRPDGCDLWVGTQAQTASQQVAMRITGLSEEKVAVHTTLLGGGFGRRSETDFVAEAVELSKSLARPIKVIWSREDDIRHDFYRPATFHYMRGQVAADGWPLAWHHRFATPSVLDRVYPIAKFILGKDPVVTDGAADVPYGFPSLKVEVKYHDTGVPVGFWRSVGYSSNVFAVECFLDEMALLGKKDPLDVRRRLLRNQPRLLNVLELAAAKASWSQAPKKGRFRGLAACTPFASYVAQVAEISIEDGVIRVHRVVCAVDCGIIVNPGIVEAQLESGIVFGLSAALKGEITLAQGRVQQSNFHDYPVLRMSEMPAVEIHLVSSGEAPGGIGEVGVPCIAPAVANAVLAATGKPVRRLPIRLAT